MQHDYRRNGYVINSSLYQILAQETFLVFVKILATHPLAPPATAPEFCSTKHLELYSYTILCNYSSLLPINLLCFLVLHQLDCSRG